MENEKHPGLSVDWDDISAIAPESDDGGSPSGPSVLWPSPPADRPTEPVLPSVPPTPAAPPAPPSPPSMNDVSMSSGPSQDLVSPVAPAPPPGPPPGPAAVMVPVPQNDTSMSVSSDTPMEVELMPLGPPPPDDPGGGIRRIPPKLPQPAPLVPQTLPRLAP